jgi:hypothetical protein
MKYGMDFLLGTKYPKTVKQEHPRSYGLGIFLEVSGVPPAYSLIDEMAGLGIPFIRVQMLWKDLHDFKPSDVSIVEQRMKKLVPIINKHKNVRWYISPCCEHELKENQFEPFAQAVLKYCLLCTVVNSPNNGKGHVSKKYLNEYHHEEKPRGGSDRFAASFDGANIVDSNVTNYINNYAKAEYLMVWNSQCNGNRKIFKPGEKRGPKDFIDRAKRIYWPTPKQIDSWIWLTTHAKGCTSVPKNWVFKSHSDQHDMPPEGKDQKPVWVKLPKFRAIEVRARNGQLVDKAPYFGPFSGGGYRYYHSDWGFTLAEKAIRIQGDGVCDIFADGKKMGQVNLAFRDGSYR